MEPLAFMNSVALLPVDTDSVDPENPVYLGVGCESGKVVPAAKALEYALQQCGIGLLPHAQEAPDYADFCEMFVEWYFSGNWVTRIQP